MAERRYADFFEVLIAQIWQDDKADIILGKALSVLPETELLQPLRNLLHWRPLRILPYPFWTGRTATLPYLSTYCSIQETESEFVLKEIAGHERVSSGGQFFMSPDNGLAA